MRSTLILLLVCSAFLAVDGQVRKDTAQADVLRLLKTYDDAWNKKDARTVDKILTPNYIYFNSEGGITTRRGTLDFLVSPKYNLTFVERSEIESYRSGETVVVSSRWKGKGTYNKELINDDQRCGLVFAKIKDEWKLAAEHCVQIKPK